MRSLLAWCTNTLEVAFGMAQCNVRFRVDQSVPASTKW
jgi:hypothetical protein